MLKMRLGRTIYIVNDDHAGAVMNEHAKCTGKHKIVKSKGPERRYFPNYWDGMSTADYVAMYYGLNSGRGQKGKGAPYGGENTLTGFYDNLNTAPAANYTEGDIYENEG
jgi:hypothetical protein